MRAKLLCKDLVTPFSYSFLLMWLSPVSPFRLDWYLKRDFSIVSKGSTESKQRKHHSKVTLHRADENSSLFNRVLLLLGVSKVWLLPLEQSPWGIKFLLLSVGWYLIKPFFWGWLPSCDQLPLQSLSAGSTK